MPDDFPTINLTSPRVVSVLLDKYGLAARKRLGQNFLIDQNTLQRILTAAMIERPAQVLEIGTGLGTLTRELAKVADTVISVEIALELGPLLEETLADLDNVRLILADALSLKFADLWQPELPRYIVANLPYYITSPLLLACLELEIPAKRMAFLVQREVAQRLVASPGSKLYGSLTVWAQALAEVSVEGYVPASVFYPAPAVASAIVTLEPYHHSEHGLVSKQALELTNRAIFGQRRKKLRNALNTSPHWQIPAAEIDKVLADLALDPGIRGESLTVKQIIALANHLADYLPEQDDP
ncbi:MAG: 16S rRNA (adenine(1518)-N(6)/adenine(1519)-N(6))-dimethyltransferase RsmA [Symbiobacteriaceae bacterium]|nr:16S rRNA (adenine(1518)-N(6)/adenine(1519)-N(6))-dimethyltransferase RsmA [Symbiobacteriaceae bacterium]